MPYSVSCTPAPLTFTIRTRFAWQSALGIAWICFVAYQVVIVWRETRSYDLFVFVLLSLISFSILLSFIRRDRIQIYPDQIVWRKTYFAFTPSKAAPLSDILRANCNERDKASHRD